MKKDFRLTADQLTWRCPTSMLKFKSTAEVEPVPDIIGQERAVRAIELGLGLEGMGYNIFVTGLSGTGRMTTIRNMVSKSASRQPNPGDWVYVNNFQDPDRPLALHLPPGSGKALAAAMDRLVDGLKTAVPALLASEVFQDARQRLVAKFQDREKALLTEFEKALKQKGFAMVQVQLGPVTRPDVTPLIQGKPIPLGELDTLQGQGTITAEEAARILKEHGALLGRLQTVFAETKTIQGEFEQKLRDLQHASVLPLMNQLFSELKAQFPTPEAQEYLDAALADLLKNLDAFVEEREEKGPHAKRDPFLAYRVNVLVDNSGVKGRPVVIEPNPTHASLFGTVERVFAERRVPQTDFTHIRAGSLLKANGGYLVLNFSDLLHEPGLWQALKRTLRYEKLYILPDETPWWPPPSPLRPEPVELSVKVIVIGDLYTYQMAYEVDEDFKKIFKVLAEFDSSMDFSPGSLREFVGLMRKIIDEEGLLGFSAPGIARVAEYAASLAGRRGKLSTRFDAVADIMREAHFWAREARAKEVGAAHVLQARQERDRRHALADDKLREMMLQDTLRIHTAGAAVGQVNGLTVYDQGYAAFGKPVRITASVALGSEGILTIDREAELGGNIFAKGSLILGGYLRQTFTRDKPLSINASIAFEQSYGGIEGDSASIAELYALLSAVAGVPARQSVAVTGSMDQHGAVQPVGGINAKIEGFFDLCAERGLDGSHGVVIPAANVEDLMLKEAVVDAVKAGKFSVWAVGHVTEGVPLLFWLAAGKRDRKGRWPAASFYGKVDRALAKMAALSKRYK
jgi:ATP-dependent Lon protease